jgi:hypothetical protein
MDGIGQSREITLESLVVGRLEPTALPIKVRQRDLDRSVVCHVKGGW